MAQKREIEDAQWFKERQEREIELANMECRCRSEALERENAAREFLERERQEQEEQERADALPTISKGPL
jgi:hypothetical protein